MEESPAVSELLDLISDRLPDLTSRPEHMDRQLAAAALVFASRALRGARVVAREGLPDLVGGLTRLIWECWCVGLHLVYAGPEAVDELAAHAAYRIRLIAERWPVEKDEKHPLEDLPIDLDAATAGLNYEEIAKKVAVALADDPDVPVSLRTARSYDVLYRYESTWTSHATWGSFAHYLQDVPDGPRTEAVDLRPSKTLPADCGIAFAAMWVAFLALLVFRRFAFDVSQIRACLEQLIADGQRFAPEAPPETR